MLSELPNGQGRNEGRRIHLESFSRLFRKKKLTVLFLHAALVHSNVPSEYYIYVLGPVMSVL